VHDRPERQRAPGDLHGEHAGGCPGGAHGDPLRSEPGRTGFIYTKTVRALRAPGAYRASVRFRWYDADGRVVRRAGRRTRLCRQPDPRPDLQAATLTAAPGLGPATVTYLLTVRNAGRGAAGPFAVGLTTAGMPQSPVVVSGLAPGESRVVELAGPRCAPGSTVRFVLDPANAVAESDEADDVVDRACPVAG
jgi:CARDB protein